MNKDGRRWITIKETAERLGIHSVTVYRMASRGQIPVAKLGGGLLVDWWSLEAGLEEQIKNRFNQKRGGGI